MCFLGKVTCDCKNENALFPAQKMINFKMWGEKSNQNTKKQPQTHMFILGLFSVSSVQSLGQNSTLTSVHMDWGYFRWPEMKL